MRDARIAAVPSLLFVATFVAAIASGVVGGVFYAFSTFVMRGLGRLSPEAGHRAMQEINETVMTPWFLGLFIGLAPLCVGLGVAAGLDLSASGAPYLLAGSIVYLVGCFIETGAVHVPMNEALAATAPEVEGGGALWQRYLARWTAWNHVRTLACIVSAALFTGALIAAA